MGLVVLLGYFVLLLLVQPGKGALVSSACGLIPSECSCTGSSPFDITCDFGGLKNVSESYFGEVFNEFRDDVVLVGNSLERFPDIPSGANCDLLRITVGPGVSEIHTGSIQDASLSSLVILVEDEQLVIRARASDGSTVASLLVNGGEKGTISSNAYTGLTVTGSSLRIVGSRYETHALAGLTLTSTSPSVTLKVAGDGTIETRAASGIIATNGVYYFFAAYRSGAECVGSTNVQPLAFDGLETTYFRFGDGTTSCFTSISLAEHCFAGVSVSQNIAMYGIDGVVIPANAFMNNTAISIDFQREYVIADNAFNGLRLQSLFHRNWPGGANISTNTFAGLIVYNTLRLEWSGAAVYFADDWFGGLDVRTSIHLEGLLGSPLCRLFTIPFDLNGLIWLSFPNVDFIDAYCFNGSSATTLGMSTFPGLTYGTDSLNGLQLTGSAVSLFGSTFQSFACRGLRLTHSFVSLTTRLTGDATLESHALSGILPANGLYYFYAAYRSGTNCAGSTRVEAFAFEGLEATYVRFGDGTTNCFTSISLSEHCFAGVSASQDIGMYGIHGVLVPPRAFVNTTTLSVRFHREYTVADHAFADLQVQSFFHQNWPGGADVTTKTFAGLSASSTFRLAWSGPAVFFADDWIAGLQLDGSIFLQGLLGSPLCSLFAVPISLDSKIWLSFPNVDFVGAYCFNGTSASNLELNHQLSGLTYGTDSLNGLQLTAASVDLDGSTFQPFACRGLRLTKSFVSMRTRLYGDATIESHAMSDIISPNGLYFFYASYRGGTNCAGSTTIEPFAYDGLETRTFRFGDGIASCFTTVSLAEHCFARITAVENFDLYGPDGVVVPANAFVNTTTIRLDLRQEYAVSDYTFAGLQVVNLFHRAWPGGVDVTAYTFAGLQLSNYLELLWYGPTVSFSDEWTHAFDVPGSIYLGGLLGSPLCDLFKTPVHLAGSIRLSFSNVDTVPAFCFNGSSASTLRLNEDIAGLTLEADALHGLELTASSVQLRASTWKSFAVRGLHLSSTYRSLTMGVLGNGVIEGRAIKGILPDSPLDYVYLGYRSFGSLCAGTTVIHPFAFEGLRSATTYFFGRNCVHETKLVANSLSGFTTSAFTELSIATAFIPANVFSGTIVGSTLKIVFSVALRVSEDGAFNNLTCSRLFLEVFNGCDYFGSLRGVMGVDMVNVLAYSPHGFPVDFFPDNPELNTITWASGSVAKESYGSCTPPAFDFTAELANVVDSYCAWNATAVPTTSPTPPTLTPTTAPSLSPSLQPTTSPVISTMAPTQLPSVSPVTPSNSPTKSPREPTESPTGSPTPMPQPTLSPTLFPSSSPSEPDLLIDDISPKQGVDTEITNVTVFGTRFHADLYCVFGTKTSPNTVVLSSTELLCEAPLPLTSPSLVQLALKSISPLEQESANGMLFQYLGECSSGPAVCSDQGTCSFGACICEDAFYGEDCENERFVPVLNASQISLVHTIILDQAFVLYSVDVQAIGGTPPFAWTFEVDQADIAAASTFTIKENGNTARVEFFASEEFISAETYQFQVSASNIVGKTTETWQVAVNPSYECVIDTPLTGTVIAGGYGAYIDITGRTLDLNTGAASVAQAIEVWADQTDRRIVRTSSDIASGSFTVRMYFLSTESGVFDLGCKVPDFNDPAGSTPQTSIEVANFAFTAQTIYLDAEPVTNTLAFADVLEVVNLGTGSWTDFQPVRVEPGLPEGVSELNVSVNAITLLGEVRLRLTSSISRGVVRVWLSAENGPHTVEKLFDIVLDIRPCEPSLSLLPSGIDEIQATKGGYTTLRFELINRGGCPAVGISASLSSPNDFSTISTPANRAELDADGKFPIDVLVNIPLDVNPALLSFPVQLRIDANNSLGLATSQLVEVVVVSDRRGTLLILTTDDFTFNLPSKPPLANATVTVEYVPTGEKISGITSSLGELRLAGIREGLYEVVVSAEGHYTLTVRTFVQAGNVRFVDAFLPVALVKYSFTAVPTTFSETYEIDVIAEYVTNVPAPVVRIEPTKIDAMPYYLGYKNTIVWTLTNLGLITAFNLSLTLPTMRYLEFESTVSVDIGDLPPGASVDVPVRVTSRMYEAFLEANSTLLEEEVGGGNRRQLKKGGLGLGFKCVKFWKKISKTEVKWVSTARAFEKCLCKVLDRTNGYWNIFATLAAVYAAYCLGVHQALGFLNFQPPRCPDDFEEWEEDKEPFIPVLEDQGGTDTAEWENLGNGSQTFDCVGVDGIWGRRLQDNSGAVLLENLQYAEDLIAVDVFDEIVVCFERLLQCASFGGLSALRCNIAETLACASEGVEEIFLSPFYSYLPSFIHIGTTQLETREFQIQADRVHKVLGLIHADLIPVMESVELPGLRPLWLDSTDEASPSGAAITASEAEGLLSGVEEDVAAAMNHTITYWNRVAVNGLQGADLDALQRTLGDAIDAQLLAIQEGYFSTWQGFVESLNLAISAIDAIPAGSQCSKVVLLIKQEAELLRDGFKAILDLENGQPEDDLTSVAVDIRIFDTNENDVSHLFAISFPQISGSLIGNVTAGVFSLPASQAGTITWGIIPRREAASNVTIKYLVGGSLSFDAGSGEISVVSLLPAEIAVSPQPLLYLDYFHSIDVFADDPFTTEVEPSLPYFLGLLVTNEGEGEALSFSIRSAQPEIIENVQSLLIDFKITHSTTHKMQNGLYSRVDNDQTLEVAMGEIPPLSSAVGVWSMESTLKGRFVNFAADVTYIPPFESGSGGKLRGLVEDVNIHALVHIVCITTPHEEDDFLPDFLADTAPFTGTPSTLFSTFKGRKHTISIIRDFDVNVTLVDHGVYRLQVEDERIATLTTSWAVAILPNPLPGKKLEGVQGVHLCNVWRQDIVDEEHLYILAYEQTTFMLYMNPDEDHDYAKIDMCTECPTDGSGVFLPANATGMPTPPLATSEPSASPTQLPSLAPTEEGMTSTPTQTPSDGPTRSPSREGDTSRPTNAPSLEPTATPSMAETPTSTPSIRPTSNQTVAPTAEESPVPVVVISVVAVLLCSVLIVALLFKRFKHKMIPAKDSDSDATASSIGPGPTEETQVVEVANKHL